MLGKTDSQIVGKWWNKTMKPQWQPIETAPKDGSRVIMWGRYNSVCIAAWRDDRWFVDADESRAIESQTDFGIEYKTFDFPSHWMPLPTPPEIDP